MYEAKKVKWKVLRIAHMMMQSNPAVRERIIGRESNVMSMPSTRGSSCFFGTT